MKKVFYVLIVLVGVSCRFAYDVVPDLEDFTLGEYEAEVMAILDETNSMVEVVLWYNEIVTYQPVDEWIEPLETLRLGYGDCKSFSLLWAFIYYEYTGEEVDIMIIDEFSPYLHAVVSTDVGIIEPQTGYFYTGWPFVIVEIHSIEKAMRWTR